MCSKDDGFDSLGASLKHMSIEESLSEPRLEDAEYRFAQGSNGEDLGCSLEDISTGGLGHEPSCKMHTVPCCSAIFRLDLQILF